MAAIQFIQFIQFIQLIHFIALCCAVQGLQRAQSDLELHRKETLLLSLFCLVFRVPCRSVQKTTWARPFQSSGSSDTDRCAGQRGLYDPASLSDCGRCREVPPCGFFEADIYLTAEANACM